MKRNERIKKSGIHIQRQHKGLESDPLDSISFDFFTGKAEEYKSAQQQDSRNFVRDIVIYKAEIFCLEEGIIEYENF